MIVDAIHQARSVGNDSISIADTTAPAVDEDRDALVLYTSGTTGRPKVSVFSKPCIIVASHSHYQRGNNCFVLPIRE